ncbi:hypothetical protein BGZ94_004340 [Podila epigama]|nr:hypothetical protein BGZ94_004340 [Podila epigama]
MSTVPSVLRANQKSRSDMSLVSRHGAAPSGASSIVTSSSGDLNSLSSLLPAYRSGPSFVGPNTPGGSISSSQSFEGIAQTNQTTPIHLAVQCAQYPVIEFVLSNTPQVDPNARDSHGQTALHIASSMGRLDVVKLLLSKNDVNDGVLDHKGKSALDVASTAEIRMILKGSAAPLIPTSPGQPPRLEGTLFKWTNYASGYKARWFVLEDGILSYFHNQEDAGNACRGSINLRIAKVWIDSNDKQRFDIIGKGSIRYHLKAGHANEAKRWILALTQSKQWIEDASGHDRPSFMDSRQSLNLSVQDASRYRNPEPSLSRGRTVTRDGTDSSGTRSQTSRSSSTSPDGTQLEQSTVPHAESFATMKNYVHAQIQMQTDISENLIRLQRAAEVPEDSEIMRVTQAIHETSLVIKDSIAKLQNMTQDREDYWQRVLEQESQKRELWEESLKTLSEEQLEMQRVLQRAEESNRKMKKHRSLRSKASTPALTPTVTMDAGAGAAGAAVSDLVAAVEGVTLAATGSQEATQPVGGHLGTAQEDNDSSSEESDAESGDEFFDAVDDDDIVEFDNDDNDNINDSNNDSNTINAQGEQVVEAAAAPTEQTGESAAARTVQQTQQEQEHVQHIATSQSSTAAGQSYITASFKGYPPKTRDRLPTKQTSLRPDVSLWAILKNSIGKDLSKITLPVYFNEPTSMLQRMAEDAEYIDLLDKAVRQRGATERILFIAAFAMSNYSSTIGRVAKPFNPLLGETYEYCREDKQFRYISEQVSHHPSKFWGKSFEVMPKGTSHVELKVPKVFAEGTTEELLSDPNDESKFVEHYSWRKVTTCVQNLIVGTPWIDNYGDMVITNHRTGETCQLTFKARGWRGKDAYEIRGFASDAKGTQVWEVAGRWNERLVARRAGKGNGDDLGSDAAAAGAIHVSDDASHQPQPHGKARSVGSHAASLSPKQVLLLWKRDPVPSTPTPFNLTPFAMTLNDCPEDLKKHLCPTDSRLRPDQRAMENGEFDLANTEKQRLEEKQRAKRRLLPPGQEHQPRWFKRNAQDDGWDFVGRDLPGQPKGSGAAESGRAGYWAERERCGATVDRPEQLKWDVADDDIF